MVELDLSHVSTNHIQRLVGALIDQGWQVVQIPANGHLERNRQLLVLQTPSTNLHCRLSIYRAGGSGRSQPHERRVEVTTTYAAGMERLPTYKDLVLGYRSEDNAYVGLDPRRLEVGGDTHNASTFVDSSCLTSSRSDRLLVSPYPAPVLGGVEYQAYFRPERLAEYLFNTTAIHDGLYLGDGIYSGSHVPSGNPGLIAVEDSQAVSNILILADHSTVRRRGEPPTELVAAYEQGDYQSLQRAHLTPEEFEAIRRRCEENGILGEQLALEYERKRLRRSGQSRLAEQVVWTSRSSVGEGFDIKSFEVDGTDRFIEVKSTIGTHSSFEMSINEWNIATSKAALYFIYRVKQVRSERPQIIEVRNPVNLEASRKLRKTASGWHVTLL